MKQTIGVCIVFLLLFSSCSRECDESIYEIAVWHGFKEVAVTYTFDDHCANQFSVALPIFDYYNFKATFYPIPSWNPDWEKIKNASLNGHEIGSHGVKHAFMSSLSVEEQEEELRESRGLINRELNNQGVRCATFAYPYCNVGDIDLVKKYYIAGRICSGQIEPSTPADYFTISSINCGTEGLNDIESFVEKLSQAKAMNGWCVWLMHGVDDNYYSSVSSEFLLETLDYLNKYRDVFWTTTFQNAVLYAQERDAVEILEKKNTKKRIEFEITDNLDNEIYNLPLTIKRTLPDAWKNVEITQNKTTIDHEIKVIDGIAYLVFDAVPDAGTVVIKKKQ